MNTSEHIIIDRGAAAREAQALLATAARLRSACRPGDAYLLSRVASLLAPVDVASPDQLTFDLVL